MSRQWTSCPSSPKHAAVTSPTQPAPMTPIGSRSGTRGAYLSEWLRRPGDGQQLPFRNGLRQRVRDPVDGAVRVPRHEPGAGAIAVKEVGPTTDRDAVGRPPQDRRIDPGEALEPEVLADLARGDHHPVGEELPPGGGCFARVRTRRRDEGGARRQEPRVVEPELTGTPADQLEGHLLADRGHAHETRYVLRRAPLMTRLGADRRGRRW